ncbi:craniofacial development protein 2-like [Sitophilus oryzae]|uniref:Craniofacial development protein 2-like n=1 Tax=Sitophilus oryzae TaxID=7048 RepID=A0A6J2YVX1_SITOR|nr:craniofacial development protein 2-like [Sitophilus oryzae]
MSHFFKYKNLYITPPGAAVGGLSSSQLSLPVPSPDKGGGFLGKASNLLKVKHSHAQSTGNTASEPGLISQITTNARKRTRNKLYMKKQQIRIACWNIKTVYSKDHELIPELNEHKIDICALSETKKKVKETTKLNNYILVYSGVPKDQRATSGVGVAINYKYEQNIESIEYVCDRILRVKIMFDQPIHIISVYAPDINKPEEMSMDFYENLQSAIDKIPRHEKIILLGDLNARI